MSNTPKVSIIVPVYNTEKYLRKCLDSLVNQTLQDIEIILVNDGSKDGSPAILEEYKAKYPDKIKLFHKENGGQATARNLALRNCTGEFIGFLDSDDYVKEEMFERLYNKAMETGADYVGTGYTDLLDTGTERKVLKEYVGNKPCKTNREMYIGGIVSPFINFFKAEDILDNDIFFTEGYIYEDTTFWLEAVPFVKKLAYVEEPLAFRVRHENSTTSTISAKRVSNIFPVFEDAIRFYKDKNLFGENPENSYHDELEYFMTRVLLCSAVERIANVEKRSERKELIKDTYTFIHKHFPNYKKNPVLAKHGGFKNKYIRFSCPLATKMLCFVFRRKRDNGNL